MASLEDQTETITEQAIKELAADGNEWPGYSEIAVAYMKRHPNYLRKLGTRKQRAAARVRSLFGRPSIEEKAPSKYRNESIWAVHGLQSSSRLEHRFIDKEGRLRKDPPGKLDYRDKRFRLVAETASVKERSPQDRFEGIAERIKALPKAVTTHGGEDQETTTIVSVGLRSDSSDPQYEARLGLQVTHLPARADAPAGEPYSIVASWDTLPLTNDVYLSVDQLYADEQAAAPILGRLEDSVRVAELARVSTQAEEEMRDIYQRAFAS